MIGFEELMAAWGGFIVVIAVILIMLLLALVDWLRRR